jgi:hypothetical protein
VITPTKFIERKKLGSFAEICFKLELFPRKRKFSLGQKGLKWWL